MKWIAALALALAASLSAGCNQKDRSPAPAPAAGSQAAPTPAAPPPPPTAQATGAATTPAAAAPTGPEIPSPQTIRRLTEVADQICACKDRACAEAAYNQLQEENKQLAGRPRATPTDAEANAMVAQAQRLSGCLKQLP
jgi:hypothetical protein